MDDQDGVLTVYRFICSLSVEHCTRNCPGQGLFLFFYLFFDLIIVPDNGVPHWIFASESCDLAAGAAILGWFTAGFLGSQEPRRLPPGSRIARSRLACELKDGQ